MMESVSKLRALPNFGKVTLNGEEKDLSQPLVYVKRQDLDELADAIEREVEQNYIELPKDADGECIHIGNVMECCSRVFEVVGLSKTQAFCFCNGRILNFDVKAIRHHKPPTVEDVLEELCLEYVKSWNGESCKSERQGIVAKYAAKLQIRED